MDRFLKAMFGGFVGRLLATIFIGICAALAIGPDQWVTYLFQGWNNFTPSDARNLLFGLAICVSLLLVLAILRTPGEPKTLTAEQIAFGLSVTGLSLFSEKLGKRKRNIQIGINLSNTSSFVIQYEVDHIFISIDGHTLENVQLANRGIILRAGETDVFRYAAFKGLALPPESAVVVSMNISYGQPKHPAVRHIKRDYSATLRVSATTASLNWAISGDDFDEPT